MTVEGYKHFIDAQSMSAFDVNAFLMSQAVTRFDTAADRDAALEQVVTEGMVSYNKDTGELQLYDGAAWQTVAVGSAGVTDHGALTGLGDDDHPQYLLKTGGTVTGQTTFSATDGVKLTGASGGVWFDDRNGDGSKYVLYHDGGFFGIWDGAQTHHRFYDSGRMDITDGGDNNYISFGPNASFGGQLYVGSTTDKAGTNTAAVISTDGNLHLDAGDGKAVYLNFYTQGRPINVYGDIGSSYTISAASFSGNGANLTNVNADTVDGQHAYEMSWGHDRTHGTWTNFNSFINTANFGAHFIQGTSNGPGQSGASQYYHMRLSLGSNYNNYSLQLAIPRNRTDSYLWYRNEEGGGVGSWYKMRAGYADSAGNADTVDGLHASSFASSSHSHSYYSTGSSVRALYYNGYGNSEITAYQTSGNWQTWTGGWATHIIANHGNGSNYYNHTLILPFWGQPHYMRKAGGSNAGPWVFWTAENSNNSGRDWYSRRSIINQGATGSWTGATVLLDTANFSASIAFHTGGVAPQFRVGHNYSAVYLRNSADNAYSTLIAIISNQSSRKDKQDITDFRNIPSPLSSNADAGFSRSGLDIVKKLRPISYRWQREKFLDQLPLAKRRANALKRLQQFRENRGMDLFHSDELVHLCGRDCDGSESDPCARYIEWSNGSFGFIAEDVAEVACELATLDKDKNYSSIDNVGLTAVAIAAIQELTVKVEQLETQIQGAT